MLFRTMSSLIIFVSTGLFVYWFSRTEDRMKIVLWALPVLLILGPTAFGDNKTIDGNWTVKYASGLAFKTFGGAEFQFRADGLCLTGVANVGHGWPGKAPISDGKIDEDHISFTVFGKLPSSDGLPRMDFLGTIQGDQIKLTMTFYSDGKHITGQTEWSGKRVPAK